jgi:hypothetical protein
MPTKNGKRSSARVARRSTIPAAVVSTTPVSPEHARDAALRDAESRALSLRFTIRELKVAAALDGLRQTLTPEALTPHRGEPYFGALASCPLLDTCDVPTAAKADHELRGAVIQRLQDSGRVEPVLVEVIGRLRDFLDAQLLGFRSWQVERVEPEGRTPAA